MSTRTTNPNSADPTLDELKKLFLQMSDQERTHFEHLCMFLSFRREGIDAFRTRNQFIPTPPLAYGVMVIHGALIEMSRIFTLPGYALIRIRKDLTKSAGRSFLEKK